jgi:hypothetical protein
MPRVCAKCGRKFDGNGTHFSDDGSIPTEEAASLMFHRGNSA